MLRDNLVELIEPMLNSAGADPLALYIHTRTPASDDRLPCLKNPRPEGAESSLTESASSPFQAEPAQQLEQSLCPRCLFSTAKQPGLARRSCGRLNWKPHRFEPEESPPRLSPGAAPVLVDRLCDCRLRRCPSDPTN